ncbi:MAG: lysylphosphatidylglycerol synthase transmembrane domain-containing protein [Chitinophagales bacterium]
MNRKTFFNLLKFGIFLGFGVFLLWLIMRNVDDEQKGQIRQSFLQANYWWVLLSVFIGILSHVLRALKWKMMLETLGRNPRFSTTFYSVMIGYLVNMAIPRFGEVTRCGIIQRYEKIPFDKSVGTLIVERAIDLLMLILATVLLFITQLDVIWNFFETKVIQPYLQKFFSSTTNLIFVFSGLLLFAALIYFLIRRWKHSTGYLKFRLFLMNIKEGIVSVKLIKNYPLFIFYTLAMWFCYYLLVIVCFNSMQETTHLTPGVGLAVLVFGTVGIVSTPGGIGAYHLIVTETLITLYALAEPYAISFSWLAWGCQTLMIVFFAIASLVLLPLTRNKYDQAASNT